jgi:hypothetical protein
MPRKPGHCKRCGGEETLDRPLSRRGLCQECGLARFDEWQRVLTEKSGPEYELYLQRRKQGYALHAQRASLEVDERYRQAESAHMMTQRAPTAE